MVGGNVLKFSSLAFVRLLWVRWRVRIRTFGPATCNIEISDAFTCTLLLELLEVIYVTTEACWLLIDPTFPTANGEVLNAGLKYVGNCGLHIELGKAHSVDWITFLFWFRKAFLFWWRKASLFLMDSHLQWSVDFAIHSHVVVHVIDFSYWEKLTVSELFFFCREFSATTTKGLKFCLEWTLDWTPRFVWLFLY